ncbi:hypothetical protein SAMN04487785_10847 [Dyella jiangningensis]|uniref:hypothetical protein n=1 Tax=Dyella sp. AtDHG13 TaxID=1938897 RepID=UPI0008803595|nr:hypothetical protein [Dyella sp. AtDHG13]PXV55954.1 hypothetical protein BDW41_110151 [Dyella sp. AtDHG13]SDK49227.1 hypothetical protein SAMN04487785_10847 [Dyella jiangningensis]
MKAVERRQHEQLLGVWKRMLHALLDIGPTSDSQEDLEAYGSVKDYILDRIDERESILSAAARKCRGKRAFLGPHLNGLPPGENAVDNTTSRGVENA